MFRRLFATCLFVACAAGSASAGQYVLTYEGVTSGSSLNGVGIADGTAFEVKATFADTPSGGSGPFILFDVFDVTANVGGVGYGVLSPTDYVVAIAPPFTTGGIWGVALVDISGGAGGGFAPFYTDLLPGEPLVFDGFLGSYLGLSQLNLVTPAGTLALAYDDLDGVAASIATPEPATLASAGFAAILGLAALRRRTRRAA